MALGDSLPAIGVFSLVEAYVLQRHVWEEKTLQTICLGTLGVNLLLNAVYSIFIWPLLLNPLRHLPRVQVQSQPVAKMHKY